VTKKKVNGVFARSFKRPLQEELRTHCKKCAGFVESARDEERLRIKTETWSLL
jgi:hypothetical protein